MFEHVMHICRHIMTMLFLHFRNLPAAVNSYYDYEQSSFSNLPSMSFVKDVTIGEGEAIPPNTNFVKTWRVKNTGKFYRTQ